MFKLPVISTNEGGISDIIKNGYTGFIVDKKNPQQLAEKISWLIDNPKKALLMGKKGQDYFFKNYTSEVI
jgi:glycosyltransferase involved in cell wall biosynthesis